MENKSVAQQWIYANNIENTSSSVVFTAPLHSNGSYPIVICLSAKLVPPLTDRECHVDLDLDLDL
jgi:hypothetical protein